MPQTQPNITDRGTKLVPLTRRKHKRRQAAVQGQVEDNQRSDEDKATGINGTGFNDERDTGDGLAGVMEDLDGFEEAIAQQSARDRAKALRPDPAEHQASDAAQGFHGDGDIELTIVENAYAPLTKTYGPGANGAAPVKVAEPRTEFGRFVRARLDQTQPMASLAAILTGVLQNQALMMGHMPGPVSMRRIWVQERCAGLPEAERARDGDGPLHRGTPFRYTPGRPGLLFVDHDAKDLPQPIKDKVKAAGGFWAVVAGIDLQWTSGLGILTRPSCSTGVRDKHTGATTPGGSVHVYAVAEDGGDIGRYARVLFDRLILAGFGYAVVTKGGGIQMRTLIDLAATGVPYWLAFEADAVLQPAADGTAQLEHVPDARDCKHCEGGRLDTTRLADLMPDEAREVAGIKGMLKAARQDEANAIKLARGKSTIDRLVAQGVSQSDAERHVLVSAEAGRLPIDTVIYFDKDVPGFGRQMSGRDILANLGQFGVKRACADPMEPSYPNTAGVTPNKAVCQRHGRSPGVWFWAQPHDGGHGYLLAYDAQDIVELVQAWREPVAEQLAKLRDLYEQAYVPVDGDLARTILGQARLPTPVVLEFTEKEALSQDKLVDALRRQDYATLARLRVLGRLFDEALDELEEAFIITGSVAGLDHVDWDGLPAMLDQAARAEAQTMDAEMPLDIDPEMDAFMRKMNARFFIVNDGRATIFEEDRDTEGHLIYRYHSPKSFKDLLCNRLVPVGKDNDGKQERKSAGVVWLAHPRRRQYMGGEVFDPRERHRQDQFNRWRGWGVKPIKGNWSLMREHIREVISAGDPVVDAYTIKWLWYYVGSRASARAHYAGP